MAITRDELIRQAEQAGKQAGSASQMLRDALRAAYSNGATSFDHADIAAMREAFRKGCNAAGKTKNAGNVLFARAYDDLIKEGLALEPRPRKGVNAKKGEKAESSDADGDASTAPKVDAQAIAAELLKRAQLDSGLVKLCIAAFKGLEELATDKKHKDAAKNARHALKECGNRINALLEAAGTGVTKDAAKTVAKSAAPAKTKANGKATASAAA